MTLPEKHPAKGSFLIIGLLLFIVMGCQKDLQMQRSLQSPATTKNAFGKPTVNPFSIRNIQKAIQSIADSQQGPQHKTIVTTHVTSSKLVVSTASSTTQYPTFVYFKFSPNDITQAQFDSLQNDTSFQLMDIPFADPAIYSDSTLDSTAIEQLKDGNIYAVAPAGDAVAASLLTASNLQPQVLDTLVEVPYTDTTLQSAALRLAGFSPSIFGICLFKQPHGYVRYWDQQMNNGAGQFEPVRGMQVWALVFGIPINTHTDGSGHYTIPWLYNVGTIMGTKAVNSRVKIMPFDVHGTVFRNVYTLIAQLLVGSLHIDGWVSTCTMRDGKDFNFSGHTQVRYWSQLLNAYYFHDQYCAQEGIHNAPSSMVCWACWTNNNSFLNGQPDFGNSVTPLAGHINLGGALVGYLTNSVFGGNLNTASGFTSLIQVVTGSILPDMIFNVPQSTEPIFYNSRLAQLAFHELGHASQYMQVGDAWYLVLADELFGGHSVPENPYGDGNYAAASHVSLAESWAEYIGTNFAIRRYPNGVKLGTSIPGINLMTYLIENEKYFYGDSWIPSGLYNDLADNYNPNEPWDNVAGATIQQMYNTFQPSITDWCGYANRFVNNYGGTFRASNIWQTFAAYNITCGISFFTSAAIVNQPVQRNNCGTGTGSVVNVSVPASMFSSLVSQQDADQQAQTYAQSVANSTGTCTAPPYTLDYVCIHSYVFQLTMTNTGTNQVYTFHLNPTPTAAVACVVPQGTYNITITDLSNTAITNFQVNTCGGSVSQSAINFSATNVSLNCSSTGIMFFF